MEGRDSLSTFWIASQRTRFGWAAAVVDRRGIRAVRLGDRPGPLETGLRSDFPGVTKDCQEAVLRRWLAAALSSVDTPTRPRRLPLRLRGTEFQVRVWRALRQIPAGHTTSYADLARRIGQPSAVRAVANACGANPVAILVPCHRIVRSDGSLGGYRWGVERKRALLAAEALGG